MLENSALGAQMHPVDGDWQDDAHMCVPRAINGQVAWQVWVQNGFKPDVKGGLVWYTDSWDV